MRKVIFFLLLATLFSCEKVVEKPKNLLPKDKMAEVMADFAIYDQSYSVNSNINMENASRFVLKKYNIKGQDYVDSYKYYVANPDDLDDIIENAKEIIKNKDFKAKEYIEKMEKQNTSATSIEK